MIRPTTIRGIDHVGLAVRNIEAATTFLKAELGAIIGAFIEKTLH
ncbi:hypothetical protein [Beijerinckia sp. L45]|nr:hypothetical protein [Beijerinckia sp. L45]